MPRRQSHPPLLLPLGLSLPGRLYRRDAPPHSAVSPHITELTESEEALAAAIYAAFDQEMRDLLRKVLKDGGIERRNAADMFFAAAIGTLKSGDSTESGDSTAKPYRARLTALTDTVLAGLRLSPTR
jgi:hypothetical protein